MPESFDNLVSAVWSHSFQKGKRRYHRFRTATSDDTFVADCIGSNLRCAHEWGWCEGILDDPRAGRFYTPEELVEKAQRASRSGDIEAFRVSGMEPVMHDAHLLEVADLLPASIPLHIETNGMLLTASYLEALTARADVRVRLSFKGTTAKQFARLSQVEPRYFTNQKQAFRACVDTGISFTVALAGVYDHEDREKLENELREYEEAVDVELEPLRLCPANEKQLQEAGFDPEPSRSG